MWDKLKKTGQFPHVARWHDFIGGQPPMCDVAQQYNTKRKRVVPPPKDAASTGPSAPAAGGEASHAKRLFRMCSSSQLSRLANLARQADSCTSLNSKAARHLATFLIHPRLASCWVGLQHLVALNALTTVVPCRHGLLRHRPARCR